MRKDNFIKTPRLNVPLGEAYRNSDGTYGLRIKKPNSGLYEDVPIDEIFKMVISGAENTAKVGSPSRRGSHPRQVK